MIKKELDHSSKSYWKNNELYDRERKKDFKIKLFGITIFHNTEDFKCDIVDEIIDGVGFQIKKK